MKANLGLTDKGQAFIKWVVCRTLSRVRFTLLVHLDMTEVIQIYDFYVICEINMRGGGLIILKIKRILFMLNKSYL